MKDSVSNGRNPIEFDTNSDDESNDGGDQEKSFLSDWNIPLPPKRSPRHRSRQSTASTNSSITTPLLRSIHRRLQRNSRDPDYSQDDGYRDENDSDFLSTANLFGDSTFVSPKKANSNRTHRANVSTVTHESEKPEGLAGWFFGFMYEDTYEESFSFAEDEDCDTSTASAKAWNPLTMAIFASYALTTAATALPILLIPSIGQDFLEEENEKSAFSSRAASSAVLGIACGKFVNGQVGDFVGARRTASLYSILLAIALLSLALSQSASSAITACFYVEFFQSVQWPCIIVLLGTHYNPPSRTSQYESGIFSASIASRCGSLVGIPVFSVLLQRLSWRLACLCGAWLAAIGSSIMYLYVKDSPTRTNEPQNPLHPTLLHQLATLDPLKRPKRCLAISIKALYSILANNVLPSFRHVLKSGTFWVVALAHTGSTMARTAERILATYFYDTSFGYVTENDAGGLAIYLSLGTVLGLGTAGKLFTQRKERQRKELVSKLYIVTIISCYSLAILAIPRVRYFVNSPDLVLFFQVVSSLCMGFGISVMYSLIPGLVGSAFGPHRGSYIAYTDGVAFGISSIVWKVVASSVSNGSQDGGGWAYGLAAVALMIVLCAILMVEFMEHYFVRPSARHNGIYKTMILA